MNRNIRNYIFIALFFIICLVPSLGMLIFGSSRAGANEVLERPPELLEKDGGINTKVLNELTTFTSDRFALRLEMITAWSWLNAKVLDTSVEEQVVLGRDGWLYYSETIDDYTGVALTDDELEKIAANLAEIQKYTEDKGAVFVVTVAPNKNTLYPQYMPKNIDCGHSDSNLARLPEFFDSYGVNYIDIVPRLQSEDGLYYLTDTHWTARGAAIAADELLKALNKPYGYSDESFSYNGTHKGDLYEMLYPSALGCEEELVFDNTLGYTCLNSTNNLNAFTIETSNPTASGTLLCWRDSFGIALYPYLADAFQSAVFSRSESFDFSAFDGKYDVILLEIAERNLPRLLEIEFLK